MRKRVVMDVMLASGILALSGCGSDTESSTGTSAGGSSGVGQSGVGATAGDVNGSDTAGSGGSTTGGSTGAGFAGSNAGVGGVVTAGSAGTVSAGTAGQAAGGSTGGGGSAGTAGQPAGGTTGGGTAGTAGQAAGGTTGGGGSAGAGAAGAPALTSLSCSELLTCAESCSGETCMAGCHALGTLEAQAMAQTLNDCALTNGCCSNSPSGTYCLDPDGDCVDADCGGEVTTCSEDLPDGSTCAGLLTCAESCSDEACLADCRAGGTLGAQAMAQALNDCALANGCCANSSGGTYCLDPDGDCVDANCEDEATACSQALPGELSCSDLLPCRETCGDEACVASCVAYGTSEARDLVHAVNACALGNGCCSNAPDGIYCLGSDDDCAEASCGTELADCSGSVTSVGGAGGAGGLP